MTRSLLRRVSKNLLEIWLVAIRDVSTSSVDLSMRLTLKNASFTSCACGLIMSRRAAKVFIHELALLGCARSTSAPARFRDPEQFVFRLNAGAND